MMVTRSAHSNMWRLSYDGLAISNLGLSLQRGRSTDTSAMEYKDYYATLGVPKTAARRTSSRPIARWRASTIPTSTRATRRAEARFKEINEAYEVLARRREAQEIRRARVDWQEYEQAPQGGGESGGQGSYRTMTADEMRNLFGNENPFSDFFHAFFSGSGEPEMRGRGGRAGTRSARPRQGRDVEHPIDLSLEERKVQGHNPPARDEARRSGTQRRCANPTRRRRRVESSRVW